MSIELTDEQTQLIKDAVNWYKNSSELVFQYTAPAGAGKSTVMHLIINQLGLEPEQVAPMAFVGSAAIVMRLNGFYNACTVHSWLYKVVEYSSYDAYKKKTTKKLKFVFSPLDKNIIKLICVDEASTVPRRMRIDMERNGIKIIACGDLNQLPPVTDDPGFLMDGKIHRLTKIMRQSKFSSIVEISNMLSKGIEPRIGNYGDVWVIPRDQLTDGMIRAYKTIICGTNKTRELMNTYVRHNLVGTDSLLPTTGEKVVCRQNNWDLEEGGINLANGLAGTVANFPSITGYNKKSFTMDFTPDLFPDIRFNDLRCDYKYFTANYITRKKMKELNFEHGNSLEKFEFSYAITTHIAQGSQFYTGIYLQEHLHKDIQNQLNYTGITRFRNFCIYVLPYQRVYCPSTELKKSVISVHGKPII